MSRQLPWVGFDLDGTLADERTRNGMGTVGDPIPSMIDLVRYYLAKCVKVKIFTARANDPEQHPIIREWLRQVGLPEDLEITATKDYAMIQSYDDRMFQVERNTGRIITD